MDLETLDTVTDIKENIQNHVGERVKLKTNKGRKKIVEHEGILENAYNNIFVVKIENAYNLNRRVSYTYSDVLTESVEVSLFDDENGNWQ
jgi:uncharacterized protein Veg